MEELFQKAAESSLDHRLETIYNTFACYFDIFIRIDNGSTDEPRKSEANQDIKDITTKGVWHCHVTMAFTRDISWEGYIVLQNFLTKMGFC